MVPQDVQVLNGHHQKCHKAWTKIGHRNIGQHGPTVFSHLEWTAPKVPQDMDKNRSQKEWTIWSHKAFKFRMDTTKSATRHGLK